MQRDKAKLGKEAEIGYMEKYTVLKNSGFRSSHEMLLKDGSDRKGGYRILILGLLH